MAMAGGGAHRWLIDPSSGVVQSEREHSRGEYGAAIAGSRPPAPPASAARLSPPLPPPFPLLPPPLPSPSQVPPLTMLLIVSCLQISRHRSPWWYRPLQDAGTRRLRRPPPPPSPSGYKRPLGPVLLSQSASSQPGASSVGFMSLLDENGEC